MVNCYFSIVNWCYTCGVQTPVYPPNDQYHNYFSGTFYDSCYGDTDSDGLPDSWEIAYFGNITSQNASWDADGDGLTNLQEYRNGTNPMSPNIGEPLGPSSRRTGWVISELMYNAPSGSSAEYLEIYNSQPWSEDISGFSIAGDVTYTFPTPTTIGAGGYLVVAKTPTGSEKGPYTGNLNNGGGTIQLKNRSGAVLLEVPFSCKPPWPGAPDGTGHSLVPTSSRMTRRAETSAGAWTTARTCRSRAQPIPSSRSRSTAT